MIIHAFTECFCHVLLLLLIGVIAVAWIKNQCSSDSEDNKFYERNVTFEEHQGHNLEQQQYCENGSGGLTPPRLLSLNPSPDLTVSRGPSSNHVKYRQPLSDIILSSISNGGGTSSSPATASMTNSDSGL